MTPHRQIVADQGLVFVDLHHAYQLDTAALTAEGIAFIGVHQGEAWAEFEPFTGRVYELPDVIAAEVERLFADADQQHADHLAALAEAEAAAMAEGEEP